MNTVILALLENKGIITEDEAEKLADFVASGVQPHYLKDAQTTIKKLLAEK